ncbi:pre-mRNA 3'-end-processing factor FIP1-like isoform X2 [Rhinatrema bivittatum]|uniref:pre-mRNA 3'-end-processing factor FIP1-like isoform X2 n=1 Tax=Rhinatrema bivittatum TaxID=194408 RepID=UPI0011268942|nr:pre-mRNA 3'-end-processing factor FIP1-like isoform X2 [Rhinatrema bivittatum]
MAAGSSSAPQAGRETEEEEEEHWLYGDDNIGRREDGALSGRLESSHALQDLSQEGGTGVTEDKHISEQAPQSEDEDSDSDSDEDDVKVTIGNIETGASSYLGTPMNLNLKAGRGYGVSVSAKLQSKGIDLDAVGNINGLPVIEVDLDAFEEKPWRKPGADLSDYFNYGFNEDTWKAYCEKQKRLQLGLDASPPSSVDNKIMIQQGRTESVEREPENNIIDPEFKSDLTTSLVGGRMKAGPPPNRKLGGTIDVIGGQSGTIRRVEGRRRDKHASEENPIQVLGDHANNPQGAKQPSSQPQQKPVPPPPPQQPPPFVSPAGPPLPLARPPPPHFLHPPPPVTNVPPPLHPPGLPPPGPIPGLFPPPLAPPPALLIPTLDGSSASYNNRQPPSFGYSSGDPGFVSYPPISTTRTPWVTMVDKGTSSSAGSRWEYSRSRRERDRERTPSVSEYSKSDDERYHYFGQERSYDYEREYRRSRDHSREREERQRDRRHREKEETSKHKSSRRKQHENEEGEGHRRHKHKKNKRSKEEKEECLSLGGDQDGRE